MFCYLSCIVHLDIGTRDIFKQEIIIGIKNQIMGLLKEISFGEFFFEMAMLFRNYQLINGTMYNMEALHGIKNKHLDTIEECDKFLMRELFECPQGTPIEAFFHGNFCNPSSFHLDWEKNIILLDIHQQTKFRTCKTSV